MIKVISVRFRTAGKVYFFDPQDLEIEKGQHVIVETARGVEYGLVVGGVREVDESKVVSPLKPVLRIATPEDDAQDAKNQERKEEAFQICLEKIRKHGLDMKLVEAEYTFDNNKVLFYFTADGRIDFRDLVKDLAAVFKTRIELRQIGVRDEIKFMGGIGVCGRVLCCHSYLSEFVPVSIKMAKEQNLSLNPTKISGVCGRLMCCLNNEEEIYEELNRKLPNVGDHVMTEDGLSGDVQSVNVLRQRVKVIVDMGDEKEIKEYHVDELQFKKKFINREKSDLTSEELAELERLERQEELDAANAEEQEQVKKERSRRNAPKEADASRENEQKNSNRNRGGRNNQRKENPAVEEENAKQGGEGKNRNFSKKRNHEKNGEGENRQNREHKQNRPRPNHSGQEQTPEQENKNGGDKEKNRNQRNRFRRFKGNGKKDGKSKGGEGQS